SLSALTDKLIIGGNTTISSYSSSTRTFTIHSPAGRTATATVDAHGRLTQTQQNGLDPLSFSFGSDGRLSSVTQGSGGSSRTTSLTYGSGAGAAYLAQVT